VTGTVLSQSNPMVAPKISTVASDVGNRMNALKRIARLA